jgi:hypothetical protein
VGYGASVLGLDPELLDPRVSVLGGEGHVHRLSFLFLCSRVCLLRARVRCQARIASAPGADAPVLNGPS